MVTIQDLDLRLGKSEALNEIANRRLITLVPSLGWFIASNGDRKPRYHYISILLDMTTTHNDYYEKISKASDAKEVRLLLNVE